MVVGTVLCPSWVNWGLIPKRTSVPEIEQTVCGCPELHGHGSRNCMGTDPRTAWARIPE